MLLLRYQIRTNRNTPDVISAQWEFALPFASTSLYVISGCGHCFGNLQFFRLVIQTAQTDRLVG